MKKIIASLNAFLCRHSFQTIEMYDLDTVKTFCPKCGNKYVVNTVHKWKFRLNEVSERDYENLRRDIQLFQEQYLKK